MKIKMKSFILALSLLLIPGQADAQVQMVAGVQETSLAANATAAPQTGTAFAISSNLTTFTWIISFASAPASHSTVLQFSNDNSTWQTLDTSTNTAGETRTVFSAARFVRAVESARSGGGAITVTIIGKGGPVSILSSGSNSIVAPDGSVASPGYAFTNETSSGWYRSSAGYVALSVLGVERFSADSTRTVMRDTDGGAYWIVDSAGNLNNSAPFFMANGGISKWGFGTATATDGQGTIINGNATTGVGLDVATDGVLKIRNRGQSSDATVQAGVFQTSAAWLAGVSSSNIYFGDTAFPTRIRSSMATPGTLLSGDWWVESDTGATTGASAAIKAQVNSATVYIAPSIRRVGRVTAQAATAASIATYTVGAADGTFEISGNVLVTTATTHTFTMECAYTDEGNTARTATVMFTLLAGTTTTSITNTNGAVPYQGVPFQIRAKAATAITIRTQAAGTYTTVVYNAQGVIKQIS